MPAVRQQINVAASPRAVWRAFTTADGLTSWWVDEARVEARTGGRVVLVSEDDDGEPMEERGVILEYRPTRKLEIAWDNVGKAPTKGSRVQVQLARAGDETRVVVVHSGGAALEDPEHHEQLSKSWRSALRALRGALED